MSEFNLISASYRRRLTLKRWLAGFLVTYVVIVLAIVVGRITLADFIESTKLEIAALNKDTESLLFRKRMLRNLQTEKAELRHKLDVLNGLVEGPHIVDVFYAIDRALNDDIWFVNWDFRRAGELIDVPKQEVNTGYIIIIADDPQSGATQAWRVHTHMEINAQAISHSALANFVRRLGKQPEVEEVQIVSTRTQKIANAEVIDFDLAVVLSNLRRADT